MDTHNVSYRVELPKIPAAGFFENNSDSASTEGSSSPDDPYQCRPDYVTPEAASKSVASDCARSDCARSDRVANAFLRVLCGGDDDEEVPSHYPASEEEAVTRLLEIDVLYKKGILSAEVERLGIRGEWLKSVFEQPRGVYFSEHLTYLPTLFSKLGQFGNSAAIIRALQSQQRLARLVEMTCGGRAATGFLTSLDFAAAAHGVTSGFYVLLPDANGKQIVRKRFLSCEEQKRFSTAAFRDVWVSGTKLEEVSRHADQLLKQRRQAERRAGHNGSKLIADAAGAVEWFLEDFKQAINELGVSGALKTSYVHYCSFIENLNRLLVKRLGFGWNFSVYDSTAASLLPTTGIEDWSQFLNAFTEAGIVKSGEPILRYRSYGPAGIYYRNLKLVDFSAARVSLQDSCTGELLELEPLLENSKKSIAQGQGPLLFPSAPIRYWVMRGVGNSLLLDDGMPYAKLDRLTLALQNKNFVLVRRSPVVYHYSRLIDYYPQNPEEPYEGLKDGADALSVLEYRRRLMRSRFSFENSERQIISEKVAQAVAA